MLLLLEIITDFKKLEQHKIKLYMKFLGDSCCFIKGRTYFWTVKIFWYAWLLFFPNDNFVLIT